MLVQARTHSEAILYEGQTMLAVNQIETATLDARVLLAHALGTEPEFIFSALAKPISAEQQEQFWNYIARRIAHEPVAYILGYKDFWKHRFLVTRDTLTPRPETELIIEQVLAHYPDRSSPLRIIDIGTGTGCILLSLLSEYKNATGVGLDISPSALAIAKLNSVHFTLAHRAEFLLSKEYNVGGKLFDVVVSNPPYIQSTEIKELSRDIREYEPITALDGGPDGLSCYREIIPTMRAIMHPHSKVFLEIGHTQAGPVSQLLRQEGLSRIAVVSDLADLPRCITASSLAL